MASLNDGSLDVCSKPFTPQKKLDIGVLPSCKALSGYGIMAIGFMANTYPSQCGIFSLACYVEVTQVVAGFLSRWNRSMFSCISDISVERESLPCHHLDESPLIDF